MGDVLASVLSVLKTTPRRWAQMAETFPPELFRRAPAPGEWSAHECLKHIIDTEKVVFPARVDCLLRGKDFPAFNPDDEGNKPKADSGSCESAREFEQLRAESLKVLSAVKPGELSGKAKHEELGMVSLEELINEWAGHDLMHTVQAERAIMQVFIDGCGPWKPYFSDHASPKDRKVEALRDVLASGHRLLEATMADVTEEVAARVPPGTALPIAACYAHVVVGEDGMVNGILKRGLPLFLGAWAGRTGLSALPPAPDPKASAMPDWTGWARTVKVDLAALRRYAEAVYASSDEFMAGLAAEDLSRPLDLTALGLGLRTVGFFVAEGLATHPFTHSGEIACLKGIRGLKGSPV